DLFFRLNVVALNLPALRDRREDILTLSRFYLERAARRQHRPLPTFDVRAERALLAHDWPGNLRELRNAVERALILSPGPNIAPEDLGIPSTSEVGDPPPGMHVALGVDV